MIFNQIRILWLTLRLFTLRSWIITVAGIIAALFLIGIPTAIIDNPYFIRMTPVRAQDYVTWVMSALLLGLIAGTFALPVRCSHQGKAAGSGILTYLAVGCPICNKLVVSLLGISGALAYFAPAQLYIGIASVAILAWTLHLRMRAVFQTCCTTVPRALKGGGTNQVNVD